MKRWVYIPFALACSGDEAPPVPRVEASLIEAERFVLADADPVPHGSIDCPPAGWGVEGATLEVDTGVCRYGVFEQTLLSDLQPTDVVELVFWHNQLVADEVAVGHLAVAIDDVVVYEIEVPIPSEPTAYTETFTGVRASPGAVVRVHLHNHGANAWNLLHIRRLAE